MPASDSDQEQGDYRLDGTLREQEEFMLKEVAAKFGITREARMWPTLARMHAGCNLSMTVQGVHPMLPFYGSFDVTFSG